MSALTDRPKARERLSQVFQSILDKMVPADESVPLPGKKFVEWEDLADEVDRTLVPVFLEERAALEASAQADCGGNCPALATSSATSTLSMSSLNRMPRPSQSTNPMA